MSGIENEVTSLTIEDIPKAPEGTKFVDETLGIDDLEKASGTEISPFKSPAFVIYKFGEENKIPPIYIKKKGTDNNEKAFYEPISASALKKAKKGADGLLKKAEKAKAAEKNKAAKEAEELAKIEASKAIKIVEPKGVSKAIKMKIRNTGDKGIINNPNSRVAVSGWIHRLRTQKGVAFLILRDGTGFLQCVLNDSLANSYQTLSLTLESTVTIYGTVNSLPEGKTAPGNRELVADYYEIVGLAPGGSEAITNIVTEGADPSLLLDQRHLVLRGETFSNILRVRAAVLNSFRHVYKEMGILEVNTPCIVQTQVEGGATLFKLNYYGQEAYLTQSSQLYLETVLPSLGDVFVVQESFRAEKSHTRRHLSEYTHLEAELAFLSFDDFLTHIETLITRAVEHVLKDEVAGPLIKQLNPKFEAPSLPFLRLKYTDALKWLNEHGIKNEEGKEFTFGDDIAEAAERQMTDEINRPIMLTNFPIEIKSFYMKRTASDPRVTDSVDVLLPNVGEVIGGSMRIDDYEELLAGFKREGINPDAYYWYIDQRKYGTCPHGGYGMGIERLLAWICDRFTVRDCQLYPRFTERAKP